MVRATLIKGWPPRIGGCGMDALAAFDNAVEKLLAVLPPIEPLPDQLARLRFLFEEEFEKVRHDDAPSVEVMLQDRRR